jgi:hypothetical protein
VLLRALVCPILKVIGVKKKHIFGISGLLTRMKCRPRRHIPWKRHRLSGRINGWCQTVAIHHANRNLILRNKKNKKNKTEKKLT